MKTKLFFIILFNSVMSFYVRGQSTENNSDQSVIKCIYKLTYYLDSTVNINSPDAYKTEYMNLLIGKRISRFESNGSSQRDSLSKTIKASQHSQMELQLLTDKISSIPRTSFRYIIYKDITTGQIYHYDRIGPTMYLVQGSDEPLSWTILPEKSKISGYLCQRAKAYFAGRTFEAWFTREIPIAEGPYKFRGLPGIIVKISDTRQHYNLELTSLIQTRTPIDIKFPDKAQNTNKHDFHEGSAAYVRSAPDRLGGMLLDPKKAEEFKQKARKASNKRNNPLELE